MGDTFEFGLGGLQDNPGVAALIGEFIARWSMAEATLMLPLLFAMGSQDQEVAAAMLSSTNSTEGKIKLVRAAVENMTERRPSRKAEIKRALKTLAALCEEQNALSHHAWAFDRSTEGAVTIDFRKPVGDPLRFTPRSEDSLRSLRNRTVEAAKEICSASGTAWVDEEVVEKLRL